MTPCDLQRPMLGAQRRVEARIGELLGKAKRGSNQHSIMMDGSKKLGRRLREDFRLLARGVNGKAAKKAGQQTPRSGRRETA